MGSKGISVCRVGSTEVVEITPHKLGDAYPLNTEQFTAFLLADCIRRWRLDAGCTLADTYAPSDPEYDKESTWQLLRTGAWLFEEYLDHDELHGPH